MAKTIYKNKLGKRIPSVTTILSVMNKPALVQWANKLGLEGVKVSEYVDELAEIGTLIHLMVENYVKQVKYDYSGIEQAKYEKANKCFERFMEWYQQNDFKLIDSEMILTCDTYGGTLDIFCELNGKNTLIDLKTSKACYPEQFTQVAGYKQLLELNGYQVDDVKILRIGREEQEGFEEITINSINKHKERFNLCLALYELNKELDRKVKTAV